MKKDNKIGLGEWVIMGLSVLSVLWMLLGLPVFLWLIGLGLYQENQANQEIKFASSIVKELENDNRYITLKYDYERWKTKEIVYEAEYKYIDKLHEYIIAKISICDDGYKNTYNIGNAVGVGAFDYVKTKDTEVNQAIQEYNIQVEYYDTYKREYIETKNEYVERYRARLCKYIKSVIYRHGVNVEYDSEKIFVRVVSMLNLNILDE